MKKFPFQFLVNTLSLAGVAFFVWWTSQGGLKKQISSLFNSSALSDKIGVQAGHIGDILFYFAASIGILALTLSFIKLIPARFSATINGWLPNLQEFEGTLLELTQQLIIFLGIYIYLLSKEGAGLKVNKINLFPFWCLVAAGLHVLGKVFSAMIPKPLSFAGASQFLRTATVCFMVAQIYGYKPFKLI